MKIDSPMLTPPCPPRPPLLQARSFDMGPNDTFLFLEEKAHLTRAADKEVRAARTATQQAARVAARLAVAGGTSAYGAGGGGTEALDSAMNLDVDIAAVSAVASFSSIFSFPDVDDCRRAASASRSARKAAAVVRGALRANLDPNYRGRLRVRCPPDALVGPSPVVHTGLSVNSSLPSSTPSSARLPRRIPQPVTLWVRHASLGLGLGLGLLIVC